jgi:ribonuclease HI
MSNKKDKKGHIVEIFADGACSGNPGKGGYAAILKYGDKVKEITGCCSYTTNNRMELTAIIEALRTIKRPCTIKVITDSYYVVKGMEEWVHKWQKNGWKNSNKKPVLNRDLWEELLSLSSKHNIKWQWIKGHHGHPENEKCDKLAKKAISQCLNQ